MYLALKVLVNGAFIVVLIPVLKTGIVLVGTLMYLALIVLVNGVFTVLLIPVLKIGMHLALVSSAV